MKTAIAILHIIISLGLMTVVLSQEGKDTGMGSISGGNSDTFFGKNRTNTFDRLLSRLTAIAAILFLVTSLCLSIFFAE